MSAQKKRRVRAGQPITIEPCALHRFDGTHLEHGMPVEFAGDEPDDCKDFGRDTLTIFMVVGLLAAAVVAALATTIYFLILR